MNASDLSVQLVIWSLLLLIFDATWVLRGLWEESRPSFPHIFMFYFLVLFPLVHRAQWFDSQLWVSVRHPQANLAAVCCLDSVEPHSLPTFHMWANGQRLTLGSSSVTLHLMLWGSDSHWSRLTPNLHSLTFSLHVDPSPVTLWQWACLIAALWSSCWTLVQSCTVKASYWSGSNLSFICIVCN